MLAPVTPLASTDEIGERFAEQGDRGSEHPVRTVVGAYVLAWSALSATMILLGAILMGVVLAGGRDDWDQSVSEWLADHRVPWVDSVTSVATFMANTFQVVAILAVVCAVLVVLRRWRDAVFLASALLLEVTCFLTANTIISRERPDVLRLDSTPSTGSFPSGHVAATLALWCGIALIVGARTRRPWIAWTAWIVAVAATVTVTVARAYRGMHHVTDVLCGIVLGIGALVAAAFVTAVVSAVVAAVAARRSAAAPDEERPLPQRVTDGR